MPNSTVSSDPPLVDVKVTNPVTYLKNWWKKIIGNEGVDIHIKARPLTTIVIVLILLGGASAYDLVVSGIRQIPYLSQIIPTSSPKPLLSPTPTTSSDWIDNAITGTLKATPNTNKYYLLTSSYIAISLEFKEDLDLSKYLGKRILASGKFNQKNHTLIISDILDLEVIPQTPIPLLTPAPSPINPPENQTPSQNL